MNPRLVPLLLLLGGCSEPAGPTAPAPEERSVYFGTLLPSGNHIVAPGTDPHRLDFAAVSAGAANSAGSSPTTGAKTTDRHPEVGTFTRLLAIEHPLPEAPGVPERTVIFRGSELPESATAQRSDLPTLWAWMDDLRDRGIESLAVAHPDLDPASRHAPATPHEPATAERRSRNEPLAAVATGEDQAAIDAMLRRGIALEVSRGLNPYQLGFVGGASGPHSGARGLTGIWAPRNAREAIYDALRQRRTFATRGQRIVVQLIASQRAGAEPAVAPGAAFADGVAMGGDLLPAPGAPRFFARALADPEGSRLQRLQMVKGWIANGTVFERHYDIACAQGGQSDPTRGCPEQATTAACDGAGALEVTWQDPAFSADQEAYYYLRVLAGPGCAAGVEAWSSPIWYHGTAL